MNLLTTRSFIGLCIQLNAIAIVFSISLIKFIKKRREHDKLLKVIPVFPNAVITKNYFSNPGKIRLLKCCSYVCKDNKKNFFTFGKIVEFKVSLQDTDYKIYKRGQRVDLTLLEYYSFCFPSLDKHETVRYKIKTEEDCIFEKKFWNQTRFIELCR